MCTVLCAYLLVVAFAHRRVNFASLGLARDKRKSSITISFTASPAAVEDCGRRERVRRAALLPLGLLLPDVPVAHPLEGLDRELGAALAVHLVAQSGGGRLVARLGDGGDERSAQLLWEDRLELGQRPGAEAVRDGEPRVLELVKA